MWMNGRLGELIELLLAHLDSDTRLLRAGEPRAPVPAFERGKPGRRPRSASAVGEPGPAPCDQTGQALRDDLPCLLHQLANDLTGRLDLPDQADALAR